MANLRREFKKFNERSYLNLNYNDIYRNAKEILKNSKNKDKDLKDLAHDLFELVVEQNIAYKTRIPSAKEVANRKYTVPSSIHAGMTALGHLHSMCKEIDPNYNPKEEFGLKEEDMKKVISDTVNKTSVIDSVLEYIEKEKYSEMLATVKTDMETLPEDITYAELSEPQHKIKLQDIYMKKELAKRQMEKHSGFWKFIFSSKVKAYKELIQKSEELLNRFHFDEKAKEEAREYYQKPNDRYDDKGFVKDFFIDKQRQKERDEIAKGKITKNVERFNKARKEEDKTKDLENKMKTITSKYSGMDATCSSIGTLKETCGDYDLYKNKNLFLEKTRQIYWAFYTEMVARQGADDLNLKQTMLDANKLTLLVMNRYTPVYEDPELAEIVPNLSFGTMDADTIVRATKKGLGGVELDIKAQAQSIIDEYKQNGNVKQDKEALGIEDKKTLINVNEVFDNESQIINPVEEENIELSKVNILD